MSTLRVEPTTAGFGLNVSAAIRSSGVGRESQYLDGKFREIEEHRPPSATQNPDVATGRGVEELLFNASAGLKVLVSQVAMHLPATWRERLFRQLDRLHDPASWDAGDAPIGRASFVTFLRTILLLGPLGKPSLGISPDGNLLAGWVSQPGTFTLEFLPNDALQWTSVSSTPDRTVSNAGRATLPRLRDLMLNDEVGNQWVSNDRSNTP
jgi:hypothetical protein